MANGVNYNYAKLISENEVTYAPRVVKYDGRTICNPKEAIYNTLGYYKFSLTHYPSDGLNYYDTYVLVGNQIVQTWVLVEE